MGAILLLLASGCELRQAMYDQQKYEPLEASPFFADGMASRQPVPGTVAQGQLMLDDHLYKGTVDGQPATALPAQIQAQPMAQLLDRGQARYDIFCSPCHDRTGSGNGMIVQRGLKQPPSYHIDRLRDMPIGYYYDVMTNGFGAMYSYASRIPVEDRWAIAAYIRALQLSQSVELERLPAEDQRQLQ
ncbi:MAG: cytochrome c [Candidatus Latescibacteria bacterium]|nr:cytochrome c [Candidatus Latescibacterota bacterium]